MTRYWLTPIVNDSPLVLGADRIHCTPLKELESLRELANGKHPRLLAMFKSSLLLSDDEELCGSELVELDLEQFEAISFDGKPFHLSHCAEAFLDRLLTRKEALELVSCLKCDVDSEHSNWINQWLRWLESGYDVILLREDGH
ncbi:hypothetical protein HZF08_07305 [Paenibacillus sp. CGMCC 1.16610]|uniref:Uncharacterized protein n=1 Tax=Paenibacillus anseongense TaxID=2682845 RepID=A0ABW9UCI6_9BACL|nr:MULTISPECIES: hypothetical protein [Paenibacillus]MBA2938109.1 hypothetical protein [Paenibacillus sp. CGMCC 1.16610]MVQ37166.1 hypothetical protein [Paenibacillus anseongense]